MVFVVWFIMNPHLCRIYMINTIRGRPQRGFDQGVYSSTKWVDHSALSRIWLIFLRSDSSIGPFFFFFVLKMSSSSSLNLSIVAKCPNCKKLPCVTQVASGSRLLLCTKVPTAKTIVNDPIIRNIRRFEKSPIAEAVERDQASAIECHLLPAFNSRPMMCSVQSLMMTKIEVREANATEGGEEAASEPELISVSQPSVIDKSKVIERERLSSVVSFSRRFSMIQRRFEWALNAFVQRPSWIIRNPRKGKKSNQIRASDTRDMTHNKNI